MLKQPFGDGPALIFAVHQIVFWYLHVIEERLAKGRVAIDQLNRFDADAGAVH